MSTYSLTCECKFSPHDSLPISQTSLSAAMISGVYVRGRPRFSPAHGSRICIARKRLIAPFLVSPDTSTTASRISLLRFFCAPQYSPNFSSKTLFLVAICIWRLRYPQLLSTRGISVPFIISYKVLLHECRTHSTLRTLPLGVFTCPQ